MVENSQARAHARYWSSTWCEPSWCPGPGRANNIQEPVPAPGSARSPLLPARAECYAACARRMLRGMRAECCGACARRMQRGMRAQNATGMRAECYGACARRQQHVDMPTQSGLTSKNATEKKIHAKKMDMINTWNRSLSGGTVIIREPKKANLKCFFQEAQENILMIQSVLNCITDIYKRQLFNYLKATVSTV